MNKRSSVELLNMERNSPNYSAKNITMDTTFTESKSSSLNSKQETVSILVNHFKSFVLLCSNL